jgi:hypothetical protein
MKYFWFFISAGSIVAVAALTGPTRALPRSRTSTHSLSADQRMLQVDATSEEIVRATITGSQFHAPEIFAAIEDYHNPRMKRLREEYALDKVIADESQEFRRLLKLRHWVHTRWPIDNNQQEGGDAFAILEKAKTGAGFHCSHSLTVQHAVMVSMGYVVRDLGIDRNHEDLGRSMHHGVNEVWSNDYAKWVLLDAKYDIHFERDGIPLSALELHEAVRSHGGKGIVKMQGVERRQAPMDMLNARRAHSGAIGGCPTTCAPIPSRSRTGAEAAGCSSSTTTRFGRRPGFARMAVASSSSTGLMRRMLSFQQAIVMRLNGRRECRICEHNRLRQTYSRSSFAAPRQISKPISSV